MSLPGTVGLGVPLGEERSGRNSGFWGAAGVAVCAPGVAVAAGGVAVLAGGVAVPAGGVAGAPGVELCPAVLELAGRRCSARRGSLRDGPGCATEHNRQ